MRSEELSGLKEEYFKRLTGIRRLTFDKMIEILEKANKEKMKNGGSPHKLKLEDRLLMSLEYWREYRTYFHISKSYGISESACYRNIVWIENVLIKNGTFSLPGKKALSAPNTDLEIVAVDATETQIERPKKKQKRYFSGKKKKHTLKSQLIINLETRLILCTSFCNGKKHDFNLYKDSRVKINPKIQSILDSGYQGIKKINKSSYTPKKKSKKVPLTKEDKARNKYLSKLRIAVENVIGSLKIFKIISERYRNRRKRFGLRFNLIAGIYNFQLTH